MTLSDTPPPASLPPRRPPSPASRTEVRLRIRVAELEAQLVEMAACLEAAERRASELLTARDRTAVDAEAERREAERRYAEIAGSRSWQLTKPFRTAAGRLRRSLN